MTERTVTAALPEPRFDTFPRHDELGRLLRAYTQARPDLFELRELGRSHEGREIWLVVATNIASGKDRDKPAFWVDGNIHAAELTACTAVLYWLHMLASGYGNDPKITTLLDTRCVYLCPRLNPDGAELALADRPRHIRSSTRPYPFDEPIVDGLSVEDVDGDGRILTMRIADPHGGWKPHPAQPRLLVPREPGDLDGPFYRVLPEGRLANWDGVTLRVNRDREGLDLNRNFPANWRQEFEQVGAGPFPASEPEVRAMVQFVVDHPNIGAALSFHTHSGVILRPMGGESDEQMIPEDLWLFKRLSKLGETLTGYPAVSIFHDFKYHPNEVISGTQDWFYEHLGALFWTVELWAPNREAGITDYDWIGWYREHPPEDDLKLLAWSDEHCEGRAHVDWYPYEHPQLGPVEIGGWDRMNYWRNPPPALREREVARFPQWLTTLALSLPKLELVAAEATRVEAGPGGVLRSESRTGEAGSSEAGSREWNSGKSGSGEVVANESGAADASVSGDLWRVRMVVGNAGYLPQYVTRRAQQRKTVRGVVFSIELPERAQLLVGKPREEAEQLDGHAPTSTLQAFLPNRQASGDRT
ncbi:MAG TPA: M14 family metallopeptidase, partial [Burkholderiaceae bacterium]|nr:M14 family metallopeptidase [Burkholderiaceae bacterium]